MPSGDPEWWVQPLRWSALTVWLGIPIFALLVQSLAGRIIWTVAVASLPLFIVLVGYHRWRRICPLAFVNQIPTLLRRPGTRRAPAWLEERYYYVPLILFCLGLWLRLVATNGDGPVLATFFVLLSVVALAFGLLFTGKTWCQYICPVSFIEKIYTEPNGLRETRNSQCAKCTACKKACPDISQENGYWKEVENRSKRLAYFAYPGLVFGFYFYYLLQSGTWEYYFGGAWTDEPGLVATAFRPGYDARTAGFYFLPSVPRAVAAGLALTACGAASFVLFAWSERLVARWLRRRDPAVGSVRVRHVTFTLAAFTAFVTFYSFAGQPTLRKLPWLPAYTVVLVVATATLFLVRRLRRAQADFAEESLARNILKRWEWDDVQPPKNLHDAYLIHVSRSREREREYGQILEAYQAAVRESLASGFVTRADVQRLESLRNQLQIKKADHERIMAALAEEERALLSDPTRLQSAEKRLQLEAYARALRAHMEQVLSSDRPPSEAATRRLRMEYGVTEEEHAAVLDEIFGGVRGIAARAADEARLIERTARVIAALEAETSPAHKFLVDLLRSRRGRAVDRLLGIVNRADDLIGSVVREGLCATAPTRRENARQLLRENVGPAVREHLFAVERDLVDGQVGPVDGWAALRAEVESADVYSRAVALLLLSRGGEVDREMLLRARDDEHELVRETAEMLIRRPEEPSESSAGGPLLTIEKMISLRAVPLFASLGPESLAELAGSSREALYAEGEALCREGETGDEVFILLSGEVEVRRIVDGRAAIVGVERAGAVIGEMAVMDPAPRAATVVGGLGDVRVLRLGGEAFRRALQADPAVADGVIRTLARRLRGRQSDRVAALSTR